MSLFDTAKPFHQTASWLVAWGVAWNRFWFTPSSPFLLSLLRILTGSLLTWSSFVWLLDAEGFFGVTGWQAADNVWRMNDQPWHWSWYFAEDIPGGVQLLAMIALMSSLALTFGLLTPLATFLSLAGYLSAVNRAPINSFGFDDALGLLLFPLLIGPGGARLSLDRLIFPKLHRADLSTRTTLALRLIQIHLCVLYFFSGTGKLLGASWWEGTAIWGAIANSQYRTLDLTFLAWHPLVVNALTLGTLFWELTYAALVWPRLTRPLVLAMAVPVHLGIGLSMGMMEFGLAMLVANMAFLAPDLGNSKTVASPFPKMDPPHD